MPSLLAKKTTNAKRLRGLFNKKGKVSKNMNVSEILTNILQELTYDPKRPLIFSSGLFLVLFLGFSFIYLLLRRRDTARIFFVTLFSYYFYYKSSGIYFLLLALVTVSDYILAHTIHRTPATIQGKRKRKCLLAMSLFIDLGFLFYFKYTNFFVGLFDRLLNHNFQPYDIFLPVGISFFTFQSLSYTIDVYRGRLKPLGSLLDYAFYVSFFPQLVAGPIVRATDFAAQIRRRLSISNTMIARGIFMIVVGLFKKAVISDYISLNFVDRIFDNPTLYTGFENLLGAFGYTLQIYCDFSGYSDMAIGIALLLGFHFPQNFNAPFKSANVQEFWKRWHISLSSWIQDYVYIYWLGGNRKGALRVYQNLLFAMTLCGLWHGASVNFVLWGCLHGVALVLHKICRTHLFRHPKHYQPAGWRRLGGIAITFLYTVFTFLIFRTQSWETFVAMQKQIFSSFHAELIPQVIEANKYVLSLIGLGLLGHYLPSRWSNRLTARLYKSGTIVEILLLVIVIYVVIQVKSSEIQPFIYFQF